MEEEVQIEASPEKIFLTKLDELITEYIKQTGKCPIRIIPEYVYNTITEIKIIYG